MTDPADFFLKPSSAAQRQYEILRAVFVDKVSSNDAAKLIGVCRASAKQGGERHAGADRALVVQTSG